MAQRKKTHLPIYYAQQEEKKTHMMFQMKKCKNETQQLYAKTELTQLRMKRTNSVINENEDLIRKPCESLNSFVNYVGQLNEICLKRMVASPDYSVLCVTENGKFIMQCKMFDNTVARGQSKIKKHAKHKAAKAVIDILNGREESRSQEYTNVTLSSPIEPFENPVGILNKTYKFHKKPPLYKCCRTENGELIAECEIPDNIVPRAKSKLQNEAKQKAAEEMLEILHDNKEPENAKEIFINDEDECNKNKRKELRNCEEVLRSDRETSRYQKHKEFTKFDKNLSNSTLNITNNINVKQSSTAETFENSVEKLNEIYYKILKKTPLYQYCGLENGEITMKCVIFDNIVTRGQSKIRKEAQEQAAKKMISLLNDREEFRSYREESTNDGEELRNDREKSKFQTHVELSKHDKTLSNSLLNIKENKIVKFSSAAELSGNDVQQSSNISFMRDQSTFKTHSEQNAAEAAAHVIDSSEKIKAHEIPINSELQCKPMISFSNENASLVTRSNNLLNFTSNVQFVNHVGKLNQICFKLVIKHPIYRTCETSNGEFIVECEMFDKTCTQGRSTTKKGAKQKAAEAMLKAIDNKIGIWQRQNNFSPRDRQLHHVISGSDIPSACLGEDLSESLSIASFDNHVGMLNEICLKNMLKVPTYIEYETENGEFTCKCKVVTNNVDTVTQGRSIDKKDAKQKAAQGMIQILMESMKLEYQTMMKSVTIQDTTSYNQQKPMEQFDPSTVACMNEETLKLELRTLNVTYRIKPVERTKNALMLKTNSTTNYKSFTFISTGTNRREMTVDLLQQAVYGLKILKN